MPKLTPLKTSSVAFGAGAAKAQPARIAMPICSSPDRVDPNDQHDLNLKDGVKGLGLKVNPGRANR